MPGPGGMPMGQPLPPGMPAGSMLPAPTSASMSGGRAGTMSTSNAIPFPAGNSGRNPATFGGPTPPGGYPGTTTRMTQPQFYPAGQQPAMPAGFSAPDGMADDPAISMGGGMPMQPPAPGGMSGMPSTSQRMNFGNAAPAPGTYPGAPGMTTTHTQYQPAPAPPGYGPTSLETQGGLPQPGSGY